MVLAASVAQEVVNVPFAHEVAGFMQPATEAQNVLGMIPMSHGLILAGILFAIGLCGVMVRRNLLFMLMSLEIMMNATALAFVVAGSPAKLQRKA